MTFVDVRFDDAVREAAVVAIRDLLPRLLNSPPRDERREADIHGEYAYRAEVVAYRGWMTASLIDLERSPPAQAFLKMLDERYPELSSFGYGVDGSWSRRSSASLLVSWLLAAAEAAEDGTDIDQSVVRVLAAAESSFARSEASFEVRFYLDGLSLPDGLAEVNLGTSSRIVALTTLQQRCAMAIFQPPMPRHVSANTALVIRRTVALSFGDENETSRKARDEDFGRELSACLLAITLLAAGQIAATHIDFTVEGPFGRSLLETRFLQHTARHRALSLKLDDTHKLETLFRRIRLEDSNSALHRGMTRLYFSEERLTAGDALVDACIGLESVLLPKAQGEQAFRIAANYAFLGTTADRRPRYDRMENLQRVRNNIVHGSSGQDHDLLALAEEGRAMLRETLLYFLHADRENLSRDREYWLSRIFGPSVG